MTNPILYHNPRCSKSRQTLALLNERGVDVEIVEYLKSPPTKAQISALVKKLGVAPRDMMRVKESIYKDLGLKEVTEDEVLITAMAENPILIERPILVQGDKAIIGRPPEAVLDLL